jgi:hypothetical protein
VVQVSREENTSAEVDQGIVFGKARKSMILSNAENNSNKQGGSSWVPIEGFTRSASYTSFPTTSTPAASLPRKFSSALNAPSIPILVDKVEDVVSEPVPVPALVTPPNESKLEENLKKQINTLQRRCDSLVS